ncbi:MAG: DAK2 domain-containing protein, partial [Clostridiales bacterium]|nr:DAK2 domain-containing protein [Clostridiales bacterium]
MSNFFIDGYLLKKMIIEGANALEENKSVVDSLNVFPVPDGDTGTNMSLTILAAAREIGKATGSRVCDIAKAAASGSLRGARGNSGVIVSQLFRGFAKGLENKETASIEDIAASFVKASETAYKAVMKPKEGTILTVSRVIAEKASEISPETEDFGEFTEGIMKAGQEILLKTTQMLPQLKEAGVVDAGGKGLL